MSEATPHKISQIKDWYWRQGRLRQGSYVLARGSWLDALYASAEVLGRDASSRKVLAVWGPSQSGKSTLLAGSLDSGEGQPSEALTWEAAAPVNFINRNVAGAVVLNPHNNGSDASGCVSRYTLGDAGVLASHPVVIRLNTQANLIHSLACGYLSECRSANPGGVKTFWDKEKIEKEFLRPVSAASIQASRPAFEFLRSVVDVLEMFVLGSAEPRYANLRGEWRLLRQALLEHPDLSQSEHAAIAFAAKVFWDGANVITDLFDRLSARLRDLAWQGKTIHCTLSVASLLLDIDTFKHVAAQQQDAHGQRIARRVDSLGFQVSGDRILVSEQAASPLLAGRAFGEFQALVRELVIPVKAPSARAEEPFYRLLKESDLLDFPGVALATTSANSAAQLDLDVTQATDPVLLTAVLKRGKTASIVMGYAKDVSIDAFALLVRSQVYPAKPDQLVNGILQWWKCVRPDFEATAGATPPMPLSICLTFFGQLMNEVGQIMTDKGLDAVFKGMIEPLAPLDRKGVATFYSTTYKSFLAAGKINIEGSQLEAAATKIRNDPSFRRLFDTSRAQGSFEAMLRDSDGGVGYFFEQQIAMLGQSSRRSSLLVLQETAAMDIAQLVRQAIPDGENPAVIQKRLVANLKAAVSRNLEVWRINMPASMQEFPDVEDATSVYAYWLRTLIGVDARDLDPIPLGFYGLNVQAKELYLSAQWAKWRASVLKRMKSCKGFEWRWLGMQGENEAEMLLRRLSEGRASLEIAAWLRDELGHVADDYKAKALREQLAIAMGNVIRYGSVYPSVAARGTDLRRQLDLFVKWEVDQSDFRTSPHYVIGIAPFLAMLDDLPVGSVGRPAQLGDDELQSIWNQAR